MSVWSPVVTSKFPGTYIARSPNFPGSYYPVIPGILDFDFVGIKPKVKVVSRYVTVS